MRLQVESRPLPGMAVIVPEIFQDPRGFFMETYRSDQFRDLGLPIEFWQENHSRSIKDVVRGLHFQWDPPMGKLMRVPVGNAFLVAVDIRVGSPTFARWAGIECSAENRRQVWAPAGFARGFCVLSGMAEIQYKCTGLYNSQAESGISWNDATLGIDWPVDKPILSEKDKRARTLSDWSASPESRYFRYQPEIEVHLEDTLGPG
jgi:dTDP-4-dehydrorhamnose 3,5-epimerase